MQIKFFPAIYAMSKETVQAFNYSKKLFHFSYLQHGISFNTKFRLCAAQWTKLHQILVVYLLFWFAHRYMRRYTRHSYWPWPRNLDMSKLLLSMLSEIMEFTNPAAIWSSTSTKPKNDSFIIGTFWWRFGPPNSRGPWGSCPTCPYGSYATAMLNDQWTMLNSPQCSMISEQCSIHLNAQQTIFNVPQCSKNNIQCSMSLNAQWSASNAQFTSMINDQWTLLNDQWTMLKAPQCSIITDQSMWYDHCYKSYTCGYNSKTATFQVYINKLILQVTFHYKFYKLHFITILHISSSIVTTLSLENYHSH